MRWSWRLLTIRGIDIRVHITFVLALAWGAYIWGNGNLAGALYGIFLTLILFMIVVLHELGHSLAAQRYGVKVEDIVVLPIGGMARLARMPDKPLQELVVALAGPAVNLALVLLLAPMAALGLTLHGAPLILPAVMRPGLLNLASYLLLVNVALLLFNMLPAFPMDGGRVLRAVLALRLSYGLATRIAIFVGRVFAVLFAVVGIFTANYPLALVALFVFSSGGAEGREAAYREATQRVTLSDLLEPGVPALRSDLPAHIAYEKLLRSPASYLAVVDENGALLGVVSRWGMQRLWALRVRGPVGWFAERPSMVLESGMGLDLALQAMEQAGATNAAVFSGNRFAGLLDAETIGQALGQRSQRSGPLRPRQTPAES